MALIQCPDCSNAVSDKAPSCPKCGAPIATPTLVREAHVQVTTIDETAKRLKNHIVISSVLFWGGVFISIVMILASAESGGKGSLSGAYMIPVLAIGIGFWWYVITKIRIWWNHK